MEGFSVTTERIASAGGGVTAVAASLATEITNMDGILSEIRAGWQSSEAAPRFVGAMELFLEQATTIKDALVSHGASLVAVGNRFGEAESALAGGIPAAV